MIKLQRTFYNHPKREADSVYVFKPDRETKFWDFEVETLAGLKLTGHLLSGEIQGHDAHLLTMTSGSENFRWQFGLEVSLTEPNIRKILRGLEQDPEFLNQFRRPADTFELIEPTQLSALIQAALGDHTLVCTGTSKRTAHSWELATKFVLDNPLPDDFKEFARKHPQLKTSRSKGKTALTVGFPRGNASEANAMLIRILSDYRDKKLETPGAYKIQVQKTDTKLVAPAVKVEPVRKAPPSLDSVVEKLKQPWLHAQDVKKALDSLKAGRDQFSNLKLDALKGAVTEAAYQHLERASREADRRSASEGVKQCIKPDEFLKRSLRWHLRGLSVEHAVMRVDGENRAASHSINVARQGSIFQLS